MQITDTEVSHWRKALKGMRNPMNSWAKSDTWIRTPSGIWRNVGTGETTTKPWNGLKPYPTPYNICCFEEPAIGPNDMKLACQLIKAGPEHRKFLRQIHINMDITIPRYVWQELDTYKVATVRNSCSTMHKLGHRDLEQSDFEGGIDEGFLASLNGIAKQHRTLKVLKGSEDAKKEALRLHRKLKQLLPEGFLQKATYSLNYETALNMFHQRKNHRLPEWNIRDEGSICSWILRLPYMKEWTTLKKEK